MSRFIDFQRQPHNRGRGRAAEDAACAYLEEQGYRILERNVFTRAGEIDIVALEDETLCFIEVKARSRSDYGPPLASVTRPKRRRLVRAATLYLARLGESERAVRFDLLGLERSRCSFRYDLIRGAFEAEESFLV